MKKALDTLEDLVNKLDNRYNSFEEKLDYIKSFLEDDIKDVISAIDKGVDRIEELEEELDDANRAAEEWEEKYNALI